MKISTNYTDDEILDVLSIALDRGDMPAAASLIRLLALQAPDKAQKIYDAVVHGTITVEIPL